MQQSSFPFFLFLLLFTILIISSWLTACLLCYSFPLASILFFSFPHALYSISIFLVCRRSMSVRQWKEREREWEKKRQWPQWTHQSAGIITDAHTHTHKVFLYTDKKYRKTYTHTYRIAVIERGERNEKEEMNGRKEVKEVSLLSSCSSSLLCRPVPAWSLFNWRVLTIFFFFLFLFSKNTHHYIYYIEIAIKVIDFFISCNFELFLTKLFLSCCNFGCRKKSFLPTWFELLHKNVLPFIWRLGNYFWAKKLQHWFLNWVFFRFCFQCLYDRVFL